MATDTDLDTLNAVDLLTSTTDIVSAHVSNNAVAPGDLPELIRSVHEALSSSSVATQEPPQQEPAVPITKSIKPDYLICLEDGRKLKMLKRHLQSAYGMTPDEYRAKWGLPADYPMVAPNYARQRSELARKIGLGKTARKAPSKRTARSRTRAAA